METRPSPEGRHHASPHPTQIGPYRVLQVLGEGGMGTVYLAEQHEPVQRRVALKLIKLGMDSAAIVARFQRERQALALMQHDGIAKVYDCGTSERGQPYFVMEYVEGVPLADYCDERRLSLRERLLLMCDVCAAVQHAHQKGVVHRDLKPGNVLVSDASGAPRVKVIDFGLAKSLEPGSEGATLFTQLGQVLGTPEYMAPEQADPGNVDIDTRADVYSLGVMLYELLVGELPFSGHELLEQGLREMQRILREVDPPRPSTRLSSTAVGPEAAARVRRMSTGALHRALKSDLDWVVMKALEKDPDRRYESPGALAADLQRFLADEPLVAGPPTAGYRLTKFVRRHRGQVLAGAAVFVTAVVGAIVAVDYAIAAERNARIAARNETVATERAEENARLATAEQAAKQGFAAKVREFDQLAGVVRLRRAVAREAELYPAWPANVGALEQWLTKDAGDLLAMRAPIARTVHDLAAAPAAQATEAQGFLHDTLATLLTDLGQFETRQVAAARQRLTWARAIEALTFAHPNARVTWDQARQAIAASERYAGQSIPLRDADVLGLVPIGANPVTGLWEFYHLRSAWDGASDPRALPIPTHAPDGSLTIGDETGIVFVLLPGGTFWLGVQRDDPTAPNFDRDAAPSEGPVQAVTLAPFLIGRYEVTNGQWARLWSGDPELSRPSHFGVGEQVVDKVVGWTNPVEQVDWRMCDTLMRQQGLALPTEAQWEYACRAGTETPYSCAFEDLPRCANVADATATRAGASWPAETWTDGYIVHAPVGSFAPNAFGLHDVHGNVWEWCADVYGDYTGPVRDGDGARLRGFDVELRCSRGGSQGRLAVAARSGGRSGCTPVVRDRDLGLRAARRLQP